MNSKPPAIHYIVETIDLLRSHFDWNAAENKILDGEDNKETQNIYTAAVRSLKENASSFVMFCDFVVRKKSTGVGNFEIVVRYYATGSYGTDLQDDEAQQIQIAIARSIIWPKFYEFARFLMTQAKIENASIPRTLEQVTFSWAGV